MWIHKRNIWLLLAQLNSYRLADYSLIEEKLTFTKSYNSINLSFTSQKLLKTKIMTIHKIYIIIFFINILNTYLVMY